MAEVAGITEQITRRPSVGISMVLALVRLSDVNCSLGRRLNRVPQVYGSCQSVGGASSEALDRGNFLRSNRPDHGI